MNDICELDYMSVHNSMKLGDWIKYPILVILLLDFYIFPTESLYQIEINILCDKVVQSAYYMPLHFHKPSSL
jgi:hypothetical protein